MVKKTRPNRTFCIP